MGVVPRGLVVDATVGLVVSEERAGRSASGRNPLDTERI
jgi:hypothetical protein